MLQFHLNKCSLKYNHSLEEGRLTLPWCYIIAAVAGERDHWLQSSVDTAMVLKGANVSERESAGTEYIKVWITYGVGINIHNIVMSSSLQIPPMKALFSFQ